MNQFPINSLYSQNSGTSSTSAFVEFFSDRDPTIYDVNFPIQKRWFNLLTNSEFILVSFSTATGFTTANWLPTGSATLSVLSFPVPNGITPVVPNGSGQVTLTSTGNTLTITGGINSINFDVIPTPVGVTWQEITTSQTFVVNDGYITNSGSIITLTLPLTAVIGDIIAIVGKGTGGWSIVQNALQSINVGTSTTTITTGSVSSSNQNDCIELICITAGTSTVWSARSWVGNLTII